MGFCGEVIIFLISHTDRSSLQPFKSMDSENKTEKLYAPEIDNFIQRYRHNRDLPVRDRYSEVNAVYEMMKGIKSGADNDSHKIWIEVLRGDIKEFGDFDEFLDAGEAETYEEFENLWREFYPEETKWYSLTVMKYEEDFYLSVNSELNFSIRVQEPCSSGQAQSGNDLSSFIDGLYLLVKEVTDFIGTSVEEYNDYVEKNLPFQKRFGRIRRKDLWEIFGDETIRPDKNLGIEIIAKFLEISVKQINTDNNPLISEMTANDFFRYCEICYDANFYFKDFGKNLTPKEKYTRMADGRDSGLTDIEGNSPQAFFNWYQSGERLGAHPWEICRGGNSTHISLYLNRQEDSWQLILAGSSIVRVEETVRMAVALYNKDIPFMLRDAEEILKMVTGEDFIGIVPDSVIPRYCHGSFTSQERIIDFMNLGHNKANEIIEKSFWYPLERIELSR